jgi:two-component system chemotaxis response regulator CheB
MAFEIVVVGTSTGGLKALQTLLSALPANFSLPIVIVQHRGNSPESGLCEYLAEDSKLPLIEPEDKEPLLEGHAYLAPRDYHLLLENRSFALSTAELVRFARPSIDVLFESAADTFLTRVVGVILTGANTDGARGLAAIKSRGGLTIVQDPDSATSRELPDAAIAQTTPDLILALDQIAPQLINLCAPQQSNELLRERQRLAVRAMDYGR